MHPLLLKTLIRFGSPLIERTITKTIPSILGKISNGLTSNLSLINTYGLIKDNTDSIQSKMFDGAKNLILVVGGVVALKIGYDFVKDNLLKNNSGQLKISQNLTKNQSLVKLDNEDKNILDKIFQQVDKTIQEKQVEKSQLIMQNKKIINQKSDKEKLLQINSKFKQDLEKINKDILDLNNFKKDFTLQKTDINKELKQDLLVRIEQNLEKLSDSNKQLNKEVKIKGFEI